MNTLPPQTDHKAWAGLIAAALSVILSRVILAYVPFLVPSDFPLVHEAVSAGVGAIIGYAMVYFVPNKPKAS